MQVETYIAEHGSLKVVETEVVQLHVILGVETGLDMVLGHVLDRCRAREFLQRHERQQQVGVDGRLQRRRGDGRANSIRVRHFEMVAFALTQERVDALAAELSELGMADRGEQVLTCGGWSGRRHVGAGLGWE